MSTKKNRHEQIQKFIWDFTQEHGYSPTVREIAAELNLATPSAAQFHLKNMEAEGLITMGSGKTRSIRLTGVSSSQKILSSSFGNVINCNEMQLRIKGNELDSFGIYDNDIAIVDTHLTPKKNDFIIVTKDDRSICCRFVIVKGDKFLALDADQQTPYNEEEYKLVGVVVSIKRNFR